MEAQFTPGPWSVADENRDDLQGMARSGNVVVYAEQDCDIHPIADCSCNQTCRLTDEQLANARLIAAAPDLYRMLKVAADFLEILPLSGGHETGAYAAVTAARMILAKARGG